MHTERWVDRCLVLDAHCDSLVLRWSRGDPMDLAVADPAYQVDLPRLRQGGVDCLFTYVGDNDLALSGLLVATALYLSDEPAFTKPAVAILLAHVPIMVIEGVIVGLVRIH